MLCGDVCDLKDVKHTYCKNRGFDKILNDVLNSPDSSFNIDFDDYLDC